MPFHIGTPSNVEMGGLDPLALASTTSTGNMDEVTQLLNELRSFNVQGGRGTFDPLTSGTPGQRTALWIGQLMHGLGGGRGTSPIEIAATTHQRGRQEQLENLKTKMGIIGMRRQIEELDLNKATAELNKFKVALDIMKELDPEPAKKVLGVLLRDKRGNVPINIDDLFDTVTKNRDIVDKMLNDPKLDLTNPKQRFAFMSAAGKFMKDPKGFVDTELKRAEEEGKIGNRALALKTAEEVRTGKRSPTQGRSIIAALDLDPAKFLSNEPGAVSPVGKIISDRDERVSKLAEQGLTPAQIAKHPDIEAFNNAIRKETGDKPDLSHEAGIRKEFTALSQKFILTRDNYSVMLGVLPNPSAAGDIALVFSFMHVIEPESIVREGEFATAANAAGVPERVRNMYNKLLAGERLSPEQRRDFSNQASNIFRAKLNLQTQLEDKFRGISRRSGFDPANTVVDYVGDMRNLIGSKSSVKDESDKFVPMLEREMDSGRIKTTSEAVRWLKNKGVRDIDAQRIVDSIMGK